MPNFPADRIFSVTVTVAVSGVASADAIEVGISGTRWPSTFNMGSVTGATGSLT